MKNDMTWERSDNSERNKQQAIRSCGNLVGSRVRFLPGLMNFNS
jgi:hypothetical protein